jgi:hypothetical protein
MLVASMYRSVAASEAQIAKMLQELHASYPKGNEYDEGDQIFYRINYRLADAFGLTREDAEKYHSAYHRDNPRRVSQGYCDRCESVVTIIPVIYGLQESDLAYLRAVEAEGTLIIDDISSLTQGFRAAMFGCRECKTLLPKYETL